MKKQFKLARPTVLAVAIAMAFSARAELDPERVEAIGELATPKNSVKLGLSYLTDDSRRFGQYSGLRDAGTEALVDLSVVGLDKTTGTWTRLYGRNLGLASREALFDYERQGQWRYFLGYSQTPRYEPYVVTTAVSGIGSTAVTVPTSPTAGKPIDLSLKRELVSAGFDHAIGAQDTVRVRFTHETKEGARLYGRGTPGASTAATAIEFLPEPDDRTTETLETSLSHVGKNFQLSGGYYGTLFVNHSSTLTVTGGSAALSNPASGAATPNAPFTPMSQPLSNDSHQLFLTGGYNLTPQTRSSFKLSETIARQNENFIDVGGGPTLAGAPRSLDGRVDTLLAYLDLTSLEFDRLDLQANLRYEDRDDKTPEAKYMSGSLDTPTVTATTPGPNYSGGTGFNKPRSWSSMKSKLEAGYALPANFKLAGGWELDQQRRNSPELFRKVNWRTETDETTLRVELKRAVSDALSAALAVSQGRRTGSDYLPDTYVNVNGGLPGTPVSNSVNPLLWADRERNAVKVSAEWSPLERVAVHLVVEQADDQYSGRPLGPREGTRQFASIDASYAISDRWQSHFWWSQDDIGAEQRTRTNPAVASSQFWQAKLRQFSEGVGAGLSGRTRSGVELGADLAYSKQSAEQRLTALTGSAITSLPDYFYRLTEFKLFASLPIDPASGLRFDYGYYDWKTNDWTWSGWAYTDGTRLSQDAHQKTHLVGLSYYYRWR